MLTLLAPPVHIYVSLGSSGGRTVYNYRVANGSAFPIREVDIGYDDRTIESELTIPPGGWDVVTDPESTYVVPQGWQYQFVTVEGEPLGQMEWSVIGSSQVIRGGQEKTFSVLPVAADSSYLNSHWTVYTTSTEVRVYSGSLQAAGGR